MDLSPSISSSPPLTPSSCPSNHHASLPFSFRLDNPRNSSSLLKRRLSSSFVTAFHTQSKPSSHHKTLNRSDYYSMLGIPHNASHTTIRSAYRQLALQLHPDVSPLRTPTTAFSHINEAYATLSDPGKRKLYDLRLALEASNPNLVSSNYGYGSVDSIASLYREWKGSKSSCSTWETDQCWC